VIRVGVDFGTTNSVVAVSDETGCRVVRHRHAAPGGPEVVEPIFPSLLALDDSSGELVYGLEAEALARRATSCVRRSIKRELFGYFEGKTFDVAGQPLDLRDALTGLLGALQCSVLDSLDLRGDEELSVVATVPANANGAQRWITRKALVDAGWARHVRLIDEPTAAALELVGRTLRRRRGQPPEPTTILIYDLGGGTFDASLVRVEGETVEVLANGGVWKLGGDDFDEELAKLSAEALGLDLDALPPLQRRNVLAECRRAKESLSTYPRLPRSLMVSLRDLGVAVDGARGADARIPVEAYAERLRPYLAAALEVVDEVLEAASRTPDRVYLVGGSTLLPFVAESLSARFANVVRGSHPFESVAVGAALSHDLAPGRLTHRLARHFGVLRLGGDDQRYEYLDVLYPRGTKLPVPGQVTLVRRGPYRPFYDVGVLRYLECATVTAEGRPGRNPRDWQVVRFPYDASLPAGDRLDGRPVSRRDDLDTRVTEEYVLDSDGIISVRVHRQPDGHTELHEVCG
jgi:molecular chaperone DnaK (HSP70)